MLLCNQEPALPCAHVAHGTRCRGHHLLPPSLDLFPLTLQLRKASFHRVRAIWSCVWRLASKARHHEPYGGHSKRDVPLRCTFGRTPFCFFSVTSTFREVSRSGTITGRHYSCYLVNHHANWALRFTLIRRDSTARAAPGSSLQNKSLL